MATGPTDPSSTRTSAEDVKNQSEFYQLLVNSTAKEKELLELTKKRAEALGLASDEMEAELRYQNEVLLNLQTKGEALARSLLTEEQINAAKTERRRLLLDIGLLEQKINNTEDAGMLTAEMATKKDREKLALKKQQLEQIKMIADGEAKSLEDILKQAGLAQETLDYKIKIGDEEKSLLKALEDNIDNEEERTNLLEKARGINQNILEVNGKVNRVTTRFAKNFKLAGDASQTFLGQQLDIFESAKGINGAQDILGKIIGKNFMQAFSFKNVLFGIVEETFKIAVNLEKASKELGKATGFGNAFNDTLRTTANNLTLMGGDETTAKNAITALTTSFSAFHPAAKETNTFLATTIGRLEMIGVSSGTSAKLMEYFNKVSGQTAKQSANTAAQIAMMGKEMGVTASKMATDFEAASGRLTIYGNKSIEVFKDLAAAAKASGIEVQTLLNISKNFDDFSGAADRIAKLNAVLGTQLSTIEMMGATDAERVMILREQVQMSVGNFESLDKYTKMYIAQAMGVSDVAEAQKLLNMSQSEYLKNQSKQKEAADVQRELAAMTAELVPTMQKLGIIAMKIFRIFTPLINAFLALGFILDKVYSFFAQFSGAMNELAPIMKIVSFIIKMGILVGLTAMATTIGPVIGSILALIGALGGLWEIFHKDGSPDLWELPEHSAKGYESLAGSMANASSATAATTKGLGDLHSTMHNMGGSKVDISAMAKLDTEKIATGITKVKSALKELSSLKIDGFLAMRTEGASTSMVMGSESLIKKFSEGKLTVDVKMPDINVKVYIGNTELKEIIRTEINKDFGRRT